MVGGRVNLISRATAKRGQHKCSAGCNGNDRDNTNAIFRNGHEMLLTLGSLSFFRI